MPSWIVSAGSDKSWCHDYPTKMSRWINSRTFCASHDSAKTFGRMVSNRMCQNHRPVHPLSEPPQNPQPRPMAQRSVRTLRPRNWIGLDRDPVKKLSSNSGICTVCGSKWRAVYLVTHKPDLVFYMNQTAQTSPNHRPRRRRLVALDSPNLRQFRSHD
jgi:hypothetical protein